MANKKLENDTKCHCEERSDEAISTVRKSEIATPLLRSGSQ